MQQRDYRIVEDEIIAVLENAKGSSMRLGEIMDVLDEFDERDFQFPLSYTKVDTILSALNKSGKIQSSLQYGGNYSKPEHWWIPLKTTHVTRD